MLRRNAIGFVSIIAITAASVAPANAQLSEIIDAGKSVFGGHHDRDEQQQQQRRGGPSAGTIIGTGACAGLGALLGGAIFGRRSTAGKVLGGLIGGAFCFSILSKNDNARLKVRSEELMQQPGSSTSVWKAPESGQNVTIETSDEMPTTEKVPFRYDAEVERPKANTIVEARSYVVRSNRLDFRNSPDEQSSDNLLGYFNKGDTVEVVGFTADRQWALLGDDGVVVGYAPIQASGVRTLVSEEEARRARAKPAPRAKGKKAPAPALASNSARAKPKAQNGGQLATRKVVTAQVSATTMCKSQVARTGDQSLSRKGCKLSDGSFRFG